MELPAAAVEALLAHWPVGRLASVAPDGAPHLVPVVFARAGARLWIPVDGKPKRARELARVRNLRREPRAALLLDRFDADWSRLWWLRVDADAEIVEAAGAAEAGGPDAGAAADAALPDALRAAADALRRKYPQYAETALFRGAPRAIALTPRRTRSWCASAAAGEAARAGAEEEA